MIVNVHVVSTVKLADALRGRAGFAEDLIRALAPRYGARVLDSSLAEATRLEALAAGLLLLDVYGADTDECLSIGPAGKPYLLDGTVSISISHGGSCCVVASAPGIDGDLGVDVEPVDGFNRLVAHRVFPVETCEWIEAADEGPVRAGRFARAWTGLEAVLKAEGTGFERDPRTEGIPDGWHVAHIAWHGHCIAVATAAPTSIELVDHDPADLMARAIECRRDGREGD